MPRKKRGPGHPVTTGSASVPPVFYRVSEDQRAQLDQEGKRRGLTGNQVAKLRAFPVRSAGRGRLGKVPKSDSRPALPTGER